MKTLRLVIYTRMYESLSISYIQITNPYGHEPYADSLIGCPIYHGLSCLHVGPWNKA